MSSNSKLSKVLEYLIKNDEEKAKELLHQVFIEKARAIHEEMMGHDDMWAAMSERDAIYANPDATEEDYMRAADLEATFAEYDGYTAEARAGELLLGLDIPLEQHFNQEQLFLVLEQYLHLLWLVEFLSFQVVKKHLLLHLEVLHH